MSCEDEEEEIYQLTWPGKRKSARLADEPIDGELIPCREESKDFDATGNIYIEGDNLDVMKLLRGTYAGGVKLIYIDPPYNTGQKFIYNDNFGSHAKWMNLIYPRLKVARDLLSDDGAIFISIDEHEVCQLRLLCDEIFGERNLISQIVWNGTSGSNYGTGIKDCVEYVLAYAKEMRELEMNLNPADLSVYKLSDEFESTRGKHRLSTFDKVKLGKGYGPGLDYPIRMPDGSLRYPGGGRDGPSGYWNYTWSKAKVEWGLANGFIAFRRGKEGWRPYVKRYERVDNTGKAFGGNGRSNPFSNLILRSDVECASGLFELRELFQVESVPIEYPKPTALIKHLLGMIKDDARDAIVLDFFSGSATTAHAVMSMNAEDGGDRKFIMVQIQAPCIQRSAGAKSGYANICEVGKERIRRAGEAILKEGGQAVRGDTLDKFFELSMDEGGSGRRSKLDVGFRVLKLAKGH